jgi:hypothetical protein
MQRWLWNGTWAIEGKALAFGQACAVSSAATWFQPALLTP